MGSTTSKKRYGIVILTGLFLIGLAGTGQAAIPRTLNFQGYLTNAAGNPVNETLEMGFSIYGTETGGAALWNETYPEVHLLSGVYSVLLGSVTPIPLDFGTQYYLGIRVGSDPEMTPRLPLSSVGYAFRAGVAEQPLIQGFPVSPLVPSANQVLRFNGTNWVPSSVNLGTDTTGVLPIAQGGTGSMTHNFVEPVAPSLASRTNSIRTLDSTGTVGWYTSIAIGTDGFPVISYYDFTNRDLKVAKCGDGSCTPASVTPQTVDSIGFVGSYPSIAIGADGFPVISYYDGDNKDLKMAKCGDASCTPASVTLRTLDSIGDVGWYNSIAIGTDGFPVISYLDTTNYDLKVAKCGDASCTPASVTPQTVDSTGNLGAYTSLAIGTDGFPVISYYDTTNHSLKVAKCGDASCTPDSVTLRTLDSIGIVGMYTSIAIGADGFPVISYTDWANGYLRLAKCGDASCSSVSPRTLDATGNVVQDTSIAIGADGFPVISYRDATNFVLKVAKCGDASCTPASVTLRTLDANGNVGAYTSITIGADGFPVISYYDITNCDLKVAKCANANCLNNWWRK